MNRITSISTRGVFSSLSASNCKSYAINIRKYSQQNQNVHNNQILRFVSLVQQQKNSSLRFPQYLSQRSYAKKPGSFDDIFSESEKEEDNELDVGDHNEEIFEDKDIELGDESDEEGNPKLSREELTKINLLRFEKANELQVSADRNLADNNYDAAETEYATCIGLFTAYLEFKFGNSESIEAIEKTRREWMLMPVIGLAFAQHCNGKLGMAEENYQQAIEWTRDQKEFEADYTRLIINYSELLCLSEKPLAAIELCESGLDTIKSHFGETSEMYAGAIANLATYNAILKKHEKALPLAAQSYEIFIKLFGKNNQYTEGSLNLYIRLLNECGRTEEGERLKKEWEDSRREAELPLPDELDQKITDQITKSFEEISKKLPFDPNGMITPPELLEEQRRQFEEKLKDTNMSSAQFLAGVEPEMRTLYEALGRSPAEYEADMKRYREDPDAAVEELTNEGKQTSAVEIDLNQFYTKKE